MTTTQQCARRAELERDLLQTQADQGGEATFYAWLTYTAQHPTEFGHEEAKELMQIYAVRPL